MIIVPAHTKRIHAYTCNMATWPNASARSFRSWRKHQRLMQTFRETLFSLGVCAIVFLFLFQWVCLEKLKLQELFASTSCSATAQARLTPCAFYVFGGLLCTGRSWQGTLSKMKPSKPCSGCGAGVLETVCVLLSFLQNHVACFALDCRTSPGENLLVVLG